MRKIFVLAVICAVAGAWAVASAEDSKESWSLKGVDSIRIDGVSGDVTILPADDGKGRIELYRDVRPSDSFEVQVSDDNGTMRLKERWYGGNSSGEVRWTIYLPEGSKAPPVRVSTASGDLTCNDVKIEIRFKTASGDIDLSGVDLKDDSDFNTASGDFDIRDMTIRDDIDFSTASGDVKLLNLEIGEDCSFSTASGDVEVSNCECADDVHFSSASGDVTVKNSNLKGEGKFSSASGNVAVYLDKMPKDNIEAASASGNVTLNVKDYGDDFTLILIKRKDKGRISCPFEYTKEDEFEDYHTYERKVVKRGSGGPTIELRTASGKVSVKK